ncbi:glycerol-3-phosphate dehydrogenase [Kineothrix alysoides]|uniref:Glycerol-3-phosphate dehydrogenase n=1 Tax=Kineothrix alysoides TaxID=1469948 RepID=A0A4R1R2E8_9FIRM|nr:NAD(P)/FAD-dependent oxidoreductase [Kineothrix alysoides]TCL59546.1 glycerol-3-phosphate dehydrogenase [Kineothrix alysoides]
MYDVIVIGAGVTGAAIARELSRYEYAGKTAVLERASDICEGTSKANSGIVHAGHDAEPGTLKARLNVLGNRKMEQLSRELDFSFKKNGTLVLCFDEKDRDKLRRLLEKGQQNGVEGLRIIEVQELRAMEPNISDEAVAALYAPAGGIVCPFGLTIALAENACENGVEFHLNTEVLQIERTQEGYLLKTSKGVFESRIVVNAAGLYADALHNMVSERKLNIIPRKGEYCLFDKSAGSYVSHTIFQLPTRYGKGVLVTPTVHGNLMMGPTAVDIEDKEGTNTTGEGLGDLLKRGGLSIQRVPEEKVITSFAGLRAHESSGDFVIGEVEGAPGFIDVAGIESPGLTCAPAIGEYVAEIVQELLPVPKKADFKVHRQGIRAMADADEGERKELIAKNPAYANIICRCELVTEGEIMDAIHRPLGATTLDGVKRRTRAGMGRCQSGFCAPKTVEILARELGTDVGEITKSGGESRFLTGYDKEDIGSA